MPFKAVQDAVLNALEQPPEKAQDSPEDDPLAAMLAMLGMLVRAPEDNAAAGEMSDEAVRQDEGNITISKCGEPGGAQDAQEVADILEGFGLLNGTENGAEPDESVAMAPGTDTAANMDTDTISRPSQGIPVKQAAAQKPEEAAVQSAQAGMLKEEPQIAAATGTIQSDPSPRKELSSFENINSPEQPQEQQTSGERPLPLDASAADKAVAAPAKQSVDIDTQAEGSGPQKQLTGAKAPAERTETFASIPVYTARSDAEVKAEPLAAAAPQQQPLTKQLDGIVERIFTSSVEGKQEFEVELKPESLGRLSVKLVLDGDGMKAVIKTDNATTKTLLQNEVAALEQALRDKGVDLSAISVAHEPASLGFNAQQRERSQQGGTRGNKRPVLMGIESYDSATVAPRVELLPSNSSVEYMA